MNIFFGSKDFAGNKEIEIIERKGSGHPDTQIQLTPSPGPFGV